MKLKAKKSPYSSIVGGGLQLVDDNGRTRFMVLFTGTTDGISKEQDAALAEQLVAWINQHGLDIPVSETADGKSNG